MKKLILIALLVSGLVYAANPQTVADSAQPLVGALEANPDFRSNFISAYIPQYGLQMTGTFVTPNFGSEIDLRLGINAIQDVVNGLSTTIKGLEKNDWVSVSATFISSPNRYVTVRVKPNQPDTLEVWIDGAKE